MWNDYAWFKTNSNYQGPTVRNWSVSLPCIINRSSQQIIFLSPDYRSKLIWLFHDKYYRNFTGMCAYTSKRWNWNEGASMEIGYEASICIIVSMIWGNESEANEIHYEKSCLSPTVYSSRSISIANHRKYKKSNGKAIAWYINKISKGPRGSNRNQVERIERNGTNKKWEA